MAKKLFGFFCVVLSSMLLNGENATDNVPVTLIASIRAGLYGGFAFEIPYAPVDESGVKIIKIGLDNWSVDTVKYNDVVDSISDIKEIPDILRTQMSEQATFALVDDNLFKYDVIAMEAVISTIMSQNNLEINKAMIRKYAKIANSSSDYKNEMIEKWKGTAQEYRGSVSLLEQRFENAIRDADEKISRLSSRMRGLADEMKNADEDRVKEIKYLMSGYSKMSGLYSTLETQIKENFKPIYVGGSIDALPSSIVSFSNAMETVSSYLGYNGNEKDGYLKLPDIPEGFFFSEQGDGNGNGEVGDGKFKSLIDYLYAAGFMPFLPPQLEGEQKISGTQSSFGRYFSFEKKEGTDENGGNSVVLHAHGVPMPEEWSAAKPWTYNPESGQWVNAYVQIGYETIKYDGLTAIEGDNYVKVNVDTKSASIEGSSGSQTQNVYYFAIGTISGGKQTSGAYYTPIIFLYQ